MFIYSTHVSVVVWGVERLRAMSQRNGHVTGVTVPSCRCHTYRELTAISPFSKYLTISTPKLLWSLWCALLSYASWFFAVQRTTSAVSTCSEPPCLFVVQQYRKGCYFCPLFNHIQNWRLGYRLLISRCHSWRPKGILTNGEYTGGSWVPSQKKYGQGMMCTNCRQSARWDKTVTFNAIRQTIWVKGISNEKTRGTLSPMRKLGQFPKLSHFRLRGSRAR